MTSEGFELNIEYYPAIAHEVITITLVKGFCKVRSNLTFTRRSHNITFLSGIRAHGVNVGLINVEI
jgi:hypothetical protein